MLHEPDQLITTNKQNSQKEKRNGIGVTPKGERLLLNRLKKRRKILPYMFKAFNCYANVNIIFQVASLTKV